MTLLTRQVSTKDLERSFKFTSNFQSSVPISITMMPVVATLTDNPEFLEDLRKEIDGKVCSSEVRRV